MAFAWVLGSPNFGGDLSYSPVLSLSLHAVALPSLPGVSIEPLCLASHCTHFHTLHPVTEFHVTTPPRHHHGDSSELSLLSCHVVPTLLH